MKWKFAAETVGDHAIHNDHGDRIGAIIDTHVANSQRYQVHVGDMHFRCATLQEAIAYARGVEAATKLYGKERDAL